DFQKNNRKADSKYTTALKNKKTIKKALAVATLEYPQYIELPDDLPQRTIELRTRIVMNKLNDLNKLFENAGGLGFLALVFNCIALGDAMSSIQDTGLMSSDEFLDIQQKLFYTVNAWTGIRTGKLWDNVRVDKTLRARSLSALKEMAKRDTTIPISSLSDLKIFNKWLAVTGIIGALASGIEAYRSLQQLDSLNGTAKIAGYFNFSSLVGLTAVGTFQAVGGITGVWSANVLFGGPIMFVIMGL
ncbi:hypothetical protein P3556_23630, partial [Vibrio parahaemolyticus]|nr:hypothetical protein [Vibrio parahaemolyticus]